MSRYPYPVPQNENERGLHEVNAHISRLTLIYVPPQQKQVHRPYTVSGEIEDFYAATEGGRNLSASQINRSASRLLHPSYNQGADVIIEHGFDTNRFAFFLELVAPLYGSDTGNEMVEVITGYTSSQEGDGGVRRSASNSSNILISPNLKMFVNNRVSFTRQTSVGRLARVKYSLEAPCMLIHNQGMRNSTIRTLRPEDTMYFEETKWASNSNRAIQRLDLRGTALGTINAPARYNVAGHYMSDLLRSYSRGVDPSESNGGIYPDFNNRITDSLSHLSALGGAGLSNADSLYYLSVCNRAPHKSSEFTFGDLCSQWGAIYVNDLTSVFMPGRDNSLIDPLDSNPWHGAHQMVMIAYQLTHVMPYILMQKLLTEIHCVITNRTHDNRPSVVLSRPMMIAEGFFDTNALEWMEGAILLNVVEGILADVECDDYNIEMTFRLLTNSDIYISLDGYPFEHYSAPMFCSSICSPQVTTEESTVGEISDAMLSLSELITGTNNPFSEAYNRSPVETVNNNSTLDSLRLLTEKPERGLMRDIHDRLDELL